MIELTNGKKTISRSKIQYEANVKHFEMRGFKPVENNLKEIGHDTKYIKAYMEAWWDHTINRRLNFESGEEFRFRKLLKKYLND